MGQKLSNALNWAAEKPSRQYTLFGSKLSFKFNRAGRFVERFNTLPAVATGAIVMAIGVPAGVGLGGVAVAGGIAAGALVMAFGKAHGLVWGGIAHLAAKGLAGLAKASAPEEKKQRIEPTL